MSERLAPVLIGIFAASAVLNIAILIGNVVLGRRSSMIFLFEGVFGAVGFLLVSELRPFAWLPLLLEPSTFWGLPRLLHEMWSTSRFNLVAAYEVRSGVRDVSLRLYRNGIFVLKQSFDPSPHSRLLELSVTGSWERDGNRVLLGIGSETAIFEIIPSVGDGEVLLQQLGFASYEESAELALGGLTLIRKS